MLVCRSSSRWALNVPLLLLAMSATAVFGGVALLLEGLSWRSVGMMLFALLVVGLSLTALRLIRLAGAEIRVTTVYGTRHVATEHAALGVRVRHSRGGSSHTVYAFDGEREVDLAESFFAAGGERLRRRLDELLFAERSTGEDAASAREVVGEREAKYQAQQAHAQQVVDGYYESGKHRRAGLWIAGIVLVYSLGMGAYFLATQ